MIVETVSRTEAAAIEFTLKGRVSSSSRRQEVQNSSVLLAKCKVVKKIAAIARVQCARATNFR